MVSQTIGGYTLDSELGRGATGVVYRAHDGRGNVVALKVLDVALSADAGFRERFAREAETMTRLDDPHCVAVYAHSVDTYDAWIAMEYVDGASLRAVLEHARTLSAPQACGVLLGALAGLGHAHQLGLVHRDVKPDNVLVDRTGTSKLADFGLVADHTRDAPSRTIEGTPAYMSPEQVRGEPPDARSDLYAAGCVLYELITGRAPYTADTPLAVMQAHLAASVPDTAALPDHIAQVVTSALAKDPNERPASAEAFAAELQTAADHDLGPFWLASASIAGLAAGILGAHAAADTLNAMHRRRPRGVKIAAAAVVALVVGSAIIAARSASRHDAAPRVPAHAVAAASTPTTIAAAAIRNVVTTSGQVGPLQLGVSTEADVRAKAGRPDATAQSSFAGTLFPAYHALGYECSKVDNNSRIPLEVQPAVSGPYCRTVYYINVKTRTLQGFHTTSPKFETARGTRAGMSAAEAERREGHAVTGGCNTGISLGAGSTAAQIFIQPRADTVDSLAADSTKDSVGVLFC